MLGPLLFILYVAPLGDIIARHGHDNHGYADDRQLYRAFRQSNSHQSLESLEKCVCDIRVWMRSNWLKLNDDKTEVMVFGSKQAMARQQSISLKIGDAEVKSTGKVKNLGIIEDPQLSMTHQVNAVCKSAFYQLRNIARIRSYLTDEATKTLVQSLVISRLDYGNSLYYGISKANMNKLQHVQNAAARLVARKSRRDHITPTLYMLHWLPVEYRVIFKLLVLVYRAVNGQAPEYLCQLLHSYTPTRALRSADQHLLQVPRTRRKNCGDRAFASVAPALWNSLPVDVKCSQTVLGFRKKLKTHLFKQAF